jgi:DNA-binding GntR family transcriptional regulator
MTSTPGLVGLTKINLREQALASLRTAITSGQLPPQTPMVETELSERLQISRGTLREAMRQLQQEGLVIYGPRGGLYVR